MTVPSKESVSERHGRECDQIVFDFLSTLGKNNPDSLFHYTTVDGMEGILANGTLRATDARHLNDPTEVIYGIGKAKEYLKGKLPSLNCDAKIFFEEIINCDLEKRIHSRSKYFISSFSSKENDLNQWRSYADGAKGFALEFSRELIDSSAKSAQSRLSVTEGCVYFNTYPVVYETTRQHAVVDNLTKLTDEALKENPPHEQRDFIFNTISICLFAISLTMKNEHYSEEKEYRFLKIAPPKHDGNKIKYRTRGSSLVPYTEFGWKSATPCPLKRVWIGPAAAHDTTPESVKEFLKHHGYGDEIEVVKSDIPYRSF